jgi:hypothetical protein
MATLREYFDADFNSVLNVANTFQLKSDGNTIECIGRVHFDFNSNTKYISCFLPECDNPVGLCVGILKSLDQILSMADDVEVQSMLPGEKPMTSKDLLFSGRVFIYSESAIENSLLEKLQGEAKANGVMLQNRSVTFAQKRSELEKPLAFISHDFRDKDAIARPIALGLIKLMRPVWFDEFSLKVGDRLRESIEKGIKECNKCVLILSPNFLSNPGWTKTEFNSIFTRELIEGTDFLLPVWCGVDKKEIFEYSPSLVDRVGVNWNLGVDEVVRRLYRSINL